MSTSFIAPERHNDLLLLVEALRPQTLQCIRGGWSHYTDTSEPVVGCGDNKYEIWIQSGIRTRNLSVTSPRSNQLSYPGPQEEEEEEEAEEEEEEEEGVIILPSTRQQLCITAQSCSDFIHHQLSF